MKLTAGERAMLDGKEGKARQKAMDLLVRYGEALGAERFVDTNNVCGTVGASTPFLREYSSKHGGMDAVFSEFNLDSAEVVEIPEMTVYSSHLQQGIESDHFRVDRTSAGRERAARLSRRQNHSQRHAHAYRPRSDGRRL